ncbi:hypothetical protein GF354_06110 [Candidatus Peregrinibacteria bacterium]|nr:hypothetical protein [Candidatus Peregrinibacteria bacterium]
MKKLLTYILITLSFSAISGPTFAQSSFEESVGEAFSEVEDLYETDEIKEFQAEALIRQRQEEMMARQAELEAQGLSQEEINEALKDEFFNDYSDFEEILGPETDKDANASENYEPTVIPKPPSLPGITTQPGPTEKGSYKKVLTDFTLPRIAIIIISFIGVGAVVFLIIGGVRYVTSYGSEDALEKAKNQVMYSLIGLGIAIMSYAIVSIIINLKFVE